MNTVSGKPHNKGTEKKAAQDRSRGNKPGKLSGGSRETKVRGCFRCNYTDHMARDQNCPARNKKCNACGAIGHFLICCKTKERKPPARDAEGRNDTNGAELTNYQRIQPLVNKSIMPLQLELVSLQVVLKLI